MAKEMNNDCQSCNGIWSNESKHFIMLEYDLFAMSFIHIMCAVAMQAAFTYIPWTIDVLELAIIAIL